MVSNLVLQKGVEVLEKSSNLVLQIGVEALL